MGFNLNQSLGAVLNPTALLGTGLSMGGDLLNYYGSRKEGEEARNQADRLNADNIALQREFAQMGIRWRVADAQAAGIHPLAALGASSASFSPSFQMADPPPSKYRLGGTLIDKMGQNITRAISATQTAQERVENELRLENMKLQNERIRVDIEKMRAENPPFPSPAKDPYLIGGQADTIRGEGVNDGRVRDIPFTRVVSDQTAPHKEAGAVSDIQIVRTKNGWAVIPSKDTKEAIEDSPMEWQWLARNVFRLYDSPTLEDGTSYKMIMSPFTGNLMSIPGTRKKRKKSDW